MDTLLQFFQQDLAEDFGYDDDTVIDQLQVAMDELRKAKMDLPPKATTNELPTLPFGLEIQPSVRELIAIKDETFDEHFRKNLKGGKAAYYRKRAGGHATTPELGGRGADTRSIQSSRLSEYSVGDQSSYDTAANSRLSIADFSGRTSPKSSRTSFDGSDMESLHHLGSRHTPVPVSPEDIEFKGIEETVELNGIETLTRDITIENMSNDLYERKPPSQASDYDNMQDETITAISDEDIDYDNVQVSERTDVVELKVEHIKSIPVRYQIPVTHEVNQTNMYRSTVDGIQNIQLSSDQYGDRQSVKRQVGASNSVHNFPNNVLNGPSTPSNSAMNGEINIPEDSSMVSNKARVPVSSESFSPVNITMSHHNSRSNPNTPTNGENFDHIIPPAKFVSQLEVRQRPVIQEHSNSYRMQVQYSEQQVQDRQSSSQVVYL